MKIRVVSDLHLEVNRIKLTKMPDEHNQWLIIAGDLCEYRNESLWHPFLEEMSNRFHSVIWLAGNHEYYKSHEAPKSEWNNVKIIGGFSSEVIYTDTKAFFLNTFWTNFRGADPLDMINAKAISDYRAIPNWTPEKAYEYNQQAYNDLVRFKANNKDYERIVVSHHAPSTSSIDERFYGDNLNSSFVNFTPGLTRGMDLWIHGHVHSSFDYEEHGCRVICNPRGYGGENIYGYGKLFDDSLVVDL